MCDQAEGRCGKDVLDPRQGRRGLVVPAQSALGRLQPS